MGDNCTFGLGLVGGFLIASVLFLPAIIMMTSPQPHTNPVTIYPSNNDAPIIGLKYLIPIGGSIHGIKLLTVTGNGYHLTGIFLYKNQTIVADLFGPVGPAQNIWSVNVNLSDVNFDITYFDRNTNMMEIKFNYFSP